MTGSPRLLRSADIAGSAGPAGPAGWPAWLGQAHAAFTDKVLDPVGYPCHFGVNSERAGHNWFTACAGPADAARLADALRAFVPVASHGPRRQSLIAFVGPPDLAPSLAAHASRFWDLLRRAGAHDDDPWPQDRPRDPAHPHWQWCFAGRPWFVFGTSPAYRRRRSRDVGPCLTMVFQLSERVFEGLSGSTLAGKAAKAQIRGRLAEYDAIGPHPHLGDPLHSSTHKWRQYFLPDDDRLLAEDACPLSRSSGCT